MMCHLFEFVGFLFSVALGHAAFIIILLTLFLFFFFFGFFVRGSSVCSFFSVIIKNAISDHPDHISRSITKQEEEKKKVFCMFFYIFIFLF